MSKEETGLNKRVQKDPVAASFLAGRENAQVVRPGTGREDLGREDLGRENLGRLPSRAQGRSLIQEPELRVTVIKVPVKQTVEEDPAWTQNASAG